MTNDDTARFLDRDIVFANGSRGANLQISSASPVNFFQVLNHADSMVRTTIDGKLFLPPEAEPSPTKRFCCVIVVPGSLGVAPSHLMHAQTLTGLGIAAFVLDPFGPRSVSSTVANQAQFSFAASAYDVLAAAERLARHPQIVGTRIGAQGHSRGGSAVMMAATRRFANAVPGGASPLHAVLAAYPWSGQQFLDPSVGTTRIRVLMGDRDGWCSAQQVQGHVHVIRLTGGNATMRIFAGAAHSFDRGTPITNVADASVTPFAPTAYIESNGAFVHPITGTADPDLVDRDLMIYSIKAGYGVRGALIGSNPGEADAFREDMSSFWRTAMQR